MITCSVVVPAFNEAASLAELHRELDEVLRAIPGEHEILFVDDGSSDDTGAVVAAIAERDPRVRLLQLGGRAGKASAYARGFDEARGELIVTLDADLQDDPGQLPLLIEAVRSQGHDFAVAWRTDRVRNEPGKTLVSAAFNLAASALLGPRLHDINSGFRAFRRAVLPSLDLRAGMHRFLPAQAQRAGFSVVEVPVHHRPRRHGHSKYSFVRAFVGLWGLWVMKRGAQPSTRGNRSRK